MQTRHRLAGLLVLLAVVLALVLAASARAETQPPLLAQVSSVFAHRPVTIDCRTEDEDPLLGWAWGYVLQAGVSDFAVLDEEVCAGALAVASDDPAVPDWQKALGVSTLVHESYHLRRIRGNGNEALTECRAFRHYDYGLAMLGASQAEIARIMPIAIGRHYLYIALLPSYAGHCLIPKRYWQYIGDI